MFLVDNVSGRRQAPSAGKHIKKVDLFLHKMINVNIELQIVLSTQICLFASVVLLDYVKLLHKIKL